MNGILIGSPGVVVGVGSGSCFVNEGIGVPGEAAAGTAVELAAGWLPEGVSPGAVTSEATRCGDRIVGSGLGFDLPGGGSVSVSRDVRPFPVVGGSASQSWQPVTVAGRAAAIGTGSFNSRSWVEIAVWDVNGVQTYIHAVQLSSEAALQFAAGLFPDIQEPVEGPGVSYPAPTRTGLQDVDPVLDAVLGAGAVNPALLAMATLPCGRSSPDDPKPGCPFGVPVGTPTLGFRVSNCKTYFAPAEAAGEAPLLLTSSSPRLFGVYRGATSASDGQAYHVIFAGDGAATWGVDVDVRAGQITSISYGCGSTNPAQLGPPLGDPKWVLPPLEGAGR